MGISRREALDRFESDDLIGIGMEADAVRYGLHPENVVGYAVCGEVRATPDRDSLYGDVRAIAAAGGTAVYLKFDPVLSIHKIEECLTELKVRFPGVILQALSPMEMGALTAGTGLTVPALVERLRAAGLDALGAGSDGTSDSIEAHRAIHLGGLPSLVSMVFGAGESMVERVDRLFAIRELQEQTGGLLAFAASAYRPSAGSSREMEEPTAVEYLRMLAISRIVLDNVPSIESRATAQNLKVVQMGLRFGCNDAGTVPHDGSASEEDLRRVIRDAGFQPGERDLLYRSFFLSN